MNIYIFILAIVAILSMTSLSAFTINLIDKKESQFREMLFSEDDSSFN